MPEMVDIEKAELGQHVVVKVAEDEYLFYSSVVDAPITYIMTKVEAYEYIDEAMKLQWPTKKLRKEFGDQRKARLEKYGTTEYGFGAPSAEKAIQGNHCGPPANGLPHSSLTLAGLARQWESPKARERFCARDEEIIPWED